MVGQPVGDAIAAPGKNIFPDQYETIEQVQEALRSSGLESSSLIVGIDFTRSNNDNGTYTYDGASLHELYEDPAKLNPYQEVISVIGRTLARFDDDGLIPAYGFGDFMTKDVAVFSLTERVEGTDRPCNGFVELLSIYKKAVEMTDLDGPTSFTPIINKAIEIVKKTGEYHIVLIITDGVSLQENLDRDTVREASNYPLSIVMVGVGDGPWGSVKIMDDLSGRKFDNLQFVNFEKLREDKGKYKDSVFAAHALQEIPPQYTAIKRLGYLTKPAPAAPQ